MKNKIEVTEKQDALCKQYIINQDLHTTEVVKHIFGVYVSKYIHIFGWQDIQKLDEVVLLKKFCGIVEYKKIPYYGLF